MFRRLPSGLPADPVFPADLTQLGYFINAEKDEVRNIKDPKSYFKFFLTKNERYNIVQREAMNEVIRKEVSARLTTLGLEKVILPLGANVSEPHTSIFISSNLPTASRIIILFYEPTQDLGIFAHRIIGGAGGINVGSAVDFVKYIQTQKHGNGEAPAIILANMGQLRWWRKGKKAVTQTSWWALPQKSAVHQPYRFDSLKNTIPENRTTAEHVNYMFNTVVERMAREDAKVQVIGVSDSAYQVCAFLQMEEMFGKWCASGRVNAIAAVATYWQESDFKEGGFKEWFRNHGRPYLTSPELTGTFLAGPLGNCRVAAYGANAYSLGEPYYSECMLPRGYKTVIDWFAEVAKIPEYVNEVMERVEQDDDDEGVPLSWSGNEENGEFRFESESEGEERRDTTL